MAISFPPGDWRRWVLIASLGLNLAAIGLIGGALLKGPPPPEPGPGPALWRYASALPDPYRRNLAEALRANRPDWESLRDALRVQAESMTTALRADPFDPTAVRNILEQQAELANRLSVQGTALLMAEIEKMSPEERAAYATALTDRRHGPKGPPKGPPPPGF